MIRLIPCVVFAALLWASVAGAVDIVNNTPYRIEVCWGCDEDRSIAGLGNNGWSDPNQGIRSAGYFALERGGRLANVQATHVLVRLFFGSHRMELVSSDIASGNNNPATSRTFFVTPNGSGYNRLIKYGSPGTSGGNSEIRRVNALRDAGFEPRSFTRLPQNGSISLTQQGHNRVTNFFKQNSGAGRTIFKLRNDSANELEFELSFRTPAGESRTFQTHPRIARGATHTFTADQPFSVVNGKLPIGVRAPDTFNPGRFLTWGLAGDANGGGIQNFGTNQTFNQQAGTMDTTYEFGVR